MTTLVIDLDRDATAARAMASALDPYVYQDDLYGALPGALPRLTVGGMLLRLHRLQALRAALTPEQAGALAHAQAALQKARADWALHYGQKIRRELGARQDSLQWYLNDCDDNPARCAEVYPIEAEKRTIIHHLLDEGAALGVDMEDERRRQLALDGALRRHFQAGPFVWDARVEAAYPRGVFWWLYGRPEAKRNE